MKLAAGRQHLSNLIELEQFAQEELPVEKCKNFIQLQKALTGVIVCKGCAAKYNGKGTNVFGHGNFMCFIVINNMLSCKSKAKFQLYSM